MEIRTLFPVLFLVSFFSRSYSTTLTIKNNCPFTIWPGTLTSKGSQVSTGFQLDSQATTTLDVPAQWSGRVWARFLCSNSGSSFSCKSADCGSGQIECNSKGAIPPATLVEFTLLASGGQDFYDVSLVDGFNLPVTVVPEKGGCSTIGCPVDINNHGCPTELAIRNTDGGVIGCKSACIAFNKPEYCCTADFGSPDTCKPTNYSQIFKQLCPQAYSYAFDDKTSLFTCPGGSNYAITFCP